MIRHQVYLQGGSILQLVNLKTLLLNSNKITEVPVESWAEKFTELQTFDIKDNPLDVGMVEVITKYGMPRYQLEGT